MGYVEKVVKMHKDIVDMYDDYSTAKSTIQEEQGVMQDISHKLEIYRTTETERQRLATIYANSARKRRRCKEVVERLSPFFRAIDVDALSESLYKAVMEMEKAKERQDNRQYTPRSERIRFDDVEKYDINYCKGDKNENAKQNNKTD